MSESTSIKRFYLEVLRLFEQSKTLDSESLRQIPSINKKYKEFFDFIIDGIQDLKEKLEDENQCLTDIDIPFFSDAPSPPFPNNSEVEVLKKQQKALISFVQSFLNFLMETLPENDHRLVLTHYERNAVIRLIKTRIEKFEIDLLDFTKKDDF
jgi:hypothetical protein